MAVVIEKPFVCGSAAFWLGKNAEEEHSHRWYVYIRGLQHEDLSYFIKSVSFALHQSFKDPVRVITKAPFEVCETGWGEFAIKITITFHDPREPQIVLTHYLKLFPENRGAQTTKKPVLLETYDEFVFVNPSEAFQQKLLQGPSKKLTAHPLAQYFRSEAFQEQQEKALKDLGAAALKVQARTEELQAKLFELEKDSTALKKQKT